MAQNNDEKKSNKFENSPYFFGASLVAFGSGVFLGIRHTLNREKVKLEARTAHRASVMIAFKALGLGTLLSFGLFSFGIGTISIISGIHTLPQFVEASSNLVSIFRKPIDPNAKDEIDEESKSAIQLVEGWFSSAASSDLEDKPNKK